MIMMIPFQVENISRKLIDDNKMSAIECYGCPKCGYIEFYAQNPKVFEKQGYKREK